MEEIATETLGCYLSLYPHKTDFNWGSGVLGRRQEGA